MIKLFKIFKSKKEVHCNPFNNYLNKKYLTMWDDKLKDTAIKMKKEAEQMNFGGDHLSDLIIEQKKKDAKAYYKQLTENIKQYTTEKQMPEEEIELTIKVTKYQLNQRDIIYSLVLESAKEKQNQIKPGDWFMFESEGKTYSVDLCTASKDGKIFTDCEDSMYIKYCTKLSPELQDSLNKVKEGKV